MNRFHSLMAVVVCLFVSFAALANDVPTTVARYTNLTLGATSPVENMTLTSGRLRMTLTRGKAAPVKAGDETVGIFFNGEGKFDYTINDAVEVSAVKTGLRNIKSSAKYTGSEAGGTISGTFREVLWIAPAAVPALSGTDAESLAKIFSSNRADFAEMRGFLASSMLALRHMNMPASKIVRAEFRGDEEWLYDYDDFQSREETLSRLFTFAFEDRSRRVERHLASIAGSPVGRTWREVQPVPFVMTKLDYEIVASDAKDVTINTKQTFVPNVSGARAISLGLIQEWFVDNKAARRLRVKKIAAADGKELTFVHSRGSLLVTLPAPSLQGKPFELRFETEGDILYRPQNSSFWRLTTGWYAGPGVLAAENATVHGVVKVKAPFTPFIAGKTVSRREENGYNVIEANLEFPAHFIFVVAGKYQWDEETRDGLTIRTASYAVSNKTAIKKITNLSFNMVKYFEYFLGPFPVTELNIVEMDDFGWGQAPAGIVFITAEAFQPIMGGLNRVFSEGINERLAHEIAHQYWGTAVKMPSYEEQWITEAFAEYSAALLLKKFQGEAVYNRLVNTWRANAKLATEQASIPLANRIFQTDDWPWERTYLLYSKGPLLLAAIHKQIGDEQFLVFLKSYQKTFRGKFGTTKDVEGLLGFLTKQDFKPFFDKYYWGTAMPEVK